MEFTGFITPYDYVFLIDKECENSCICCPWPYQDPGWLTTIEFCGQKWRSNVSALKLNTPLLYDDDTSLMLPRTLGEPFW